MNLNIRHFTSNATGELVPVGGGEHAFIPNPLPPAWKFPETLWPLLGEVKQQVGILEGLGRTLPNPAILIRPLADREAIRSSRLEGTYTTAKELLLFELEPKEPKSEPDLSNDQREVWNYRRALEHGTNTDLPISLRLIREMHEILLLGVRGRNRAPGEFRRVQVAIAPASRFVPPPPERIMECLTPLERYFHLEISPYDPLVDCFLAHYQFETIHPFVDGNGRVGRLLLAIMLQHRCRLSKPWLYMSEFFDRNRDEYIDLLYRVSTQGDWSAWIEFCLRGTAQHAKETISRCEHLRSIREEFLRRISTVWGSVRLSKIVESVFHSPFVRVADLPASLNVTYPTAKSDVERLVQAGILRELHNITPKTFFAPEVFDVAYDAMDEN